MKNVFYAVWVVDGTEQLIPSRKHNFHRSIAAAARALERRARRHPVKAGGLLRTVKESAC